MTPLAHAIAQTTANLTSLAQLEIPLQAAADLTLATLQRGHKILLCGNGGSACDATHFATELLCRYSRDRAPYPAITLTANGDFLTAATNDYDPTTIFSRQIQALARPGDLLITFSTSGNSPNIIRALEQSRFNHISSIAFLGPIGGQCHGLASVQLLAPGQTTARIQEMHQILFHTICHIIDPQL